MAKKSLYLLAVSLLLVVAEQGITLADKGPEHREEQARPIKLGTSGGNINDSSLLYCCGGTLGALVQDESNLYILSNNHVLARTNSAAENEEIIQPGLIDQTPVCYEDTGDTVAEFSNFIDIWFGGPENEVDAAIAKVVGDAVEPNGAILDIGLVNLDTVSAFVGQSVKKSGRTTGLTTGTIRAIDVTVDVGYSEECGGPVTQVARFVNQILIRPGKFSASGDSGSLIVEKTDLNPRAVGLLFAGSSKATLANPIDSALGALGVIMVGETVPEPPPPPPPPGTGTITGTVTNKTNAEPIAGAKVRADTGQSAKTDTNGAYILTTVPVGQRSIKASAKGFKSQTETATINEGGQTIVIDFDLEPRRSGPHGKALGRAIKVKKHHEKKIFKISGVVGTGVSLLETKQPIIEVYLEKDSPKARAKIPAELDNIPVMVVVTGPFVAY